jgi:hypothetical protein
MSEIMREVRVNAFASSAPPGAVAAYEAEAEDDQSSDGEFEAQHEPRFDSGAQLDVGLQRMFKRKFGAGLHDLVPVMKVAIQSMDYIKPEVSWQGHGVKERSA